MTNDDLKSPLHDEIMLWLDKNAERLLLEKPPEFYAGRIMAETHGWEHARGKIVAAMLENKKWQQPIRNEDRAIIGFVDMVCTMRCDLELPEYYKERSRGKPEVPRGILNCCVMVRPSIPSLSQLFREINTCKVYLEPPTQFYVVSPDDRYSDILESQGIMFIKYSK